MWLPSVYADIDLGTSFSVSLFSSMHASMWQKLEDNPGEDLAMPTNKNLSMSPQGPDRGKFLYLSSKAGFFNPCLFLKSLSHSATVTAYSF